MTFSNQDKSDQDLNDLFGEVIYSYTSDQATDDGILFNLMLLKPYFKDMDRSIFNYATTNLLYSLGYIEDSRSIKGIEDKKIITTTGDIKINIPSIMDLLNQAIKILKESKKKNDWFYSGKIEDPNGSEKEIYICQNETGRYTLMLPEDY